MNMSNNKRYLAVLKCCPKMAGRWVVVVLYTLILLATLPFARIMWDWIGTERGYVLLIGLYCSAIGYMYFRYKNILIIGLAFLIILAIFKIIPLPIERIHFIEYGLLGWLVWWTIGERKWGFIMALGYIVAISILDEIIQGMLPNRVYDIRDIWMNAVGGSLGLVLGIYER